METYNVKFLTPGQVIIYRGRRFRTPVIFESVLEKEIPFFDAQARRSLIKYEVIKTSDIEREFPIEQLILDKEDEDIEVEKSIVDKEPSTILEKLIVNDQEE